MQLADTLSEQGGRFQPGRIRLQLQRVWLMETAPVEKRNDAWWKCLFFSATPRTTSLDLSVTANAPDTYWLEHFYLSRACVPACLHPVDKNVSDRKTSWRLGWTGGQNQSERFKNIRRSRLSKAVISTKTQLLICVSPLQQNERKSFSLEILVFFYYLLNATMLKKSVIFNLHQWNVSECHVPFMNTNAALSARHESQFGQTCWGSKQRWKEKTQRDYITAGVCVFFVADQINYSSVWRTESSFPQNKGTDAINPPKLIIVH